MAVQRSLPRNHEYTLADLTTLRRRRGVVRIQLERIPWRPNSDSNAGGWARSIREDMSLVAVASPAADFRPHHSIA